MARVEDVELRESTELHAAMEQQVRAFRELGAAQRHVLEVGLVGGGAAFQEDRRWLLVGVLGDLGRVVVAHLVVVPRDDPGDLRVHGLKRGIGFVDRVALAVVVDSENFFLAVRADGAG